VRDRRNSGTHKRRPERFAGYGGAARRGAARRAATLGAVATLSQPCAVRATTTREEEAPPPLLAVARRDATRRDATRRRAIVRPSRALVRVRTSSETRDPRPSRSSGEVCACSSCHHHPAGAAESENTEARRPPLLPSSPRRSSPFASSCAPLALPRHPSLSLAAPRDARLFEIDGREDAPGMRQQD